MEIQNQACHLSAAGILLWPAWTAAEVTSVERGTMMPAWWAGNLQDWARHGLAYSVNENVLLFRHGNPPPVTDGMKSL